MPTLGLVPRAFVPDALPIPALSTPIFPLAVSANARYLVDVNGNPWMLKGDAGWMMANHVGVSDQNDYLDHLVSQGFNATILMNIVHQGGGSWPNISEPADSAGVQPFTGTLAGGSANLATANDTYFDKVVDYIQRARSRNIAILFFVCYSGSGGGADGWTTTLAANTNTACFNFGAYCAGKFGSLPNVIPMWMGDWTLAGTDLTRFQQLVAGWLSVQPNLIAGSELEGPDSLVTDQTGFTYGPTPSSTVHMHINSYYGAGPDGDGRTYDTALRGWDNSPTLPCQLQEPVYENAWYNANNTRVQLRAAHHWCKTSGTHNTVTGVHGRWQGNPVGNESALAAQGGAASWRTNLSGNVDDDAQRSFNFYSALEWWKLVPSGTAAGRAGRLLITTTNTANTAYISSSIASDGSFLVAYVASNGTGARTFSVDLRSMRGDSRARWWNPTTGAFTDITSGDYTLANTIAASSFTTPGNNGTGTNDWILILDTRTPLYETTFSTAENPISEGGRWSSTDALRTRIQVSGGVAHGTQVGGSYDDSYALLTTTALPAGVSSWPADIEMVSTIFKGTTAGFQEIEHLHRATETTSSAQYYEINLARDGQYLEFIEALGGSDGLEDFRIFASFDTAGAVANGWRLKTRVKGSTLSAWVDRMDGVGWVLIGTQTDTARSSGRPGIGTFKTDDGGANNQFAQTDLKVYAV